MISRKKRVLIVTPSNFPYEDAAAIRDMSFAKIYFALGYEVYCICCNNRSKYGTSEMVKWVSTFKSYSTFLQHIFVVLGNASRYIKEFKNYITLYGNPDVIHYSGSELRFFVFLRKYAEANNIVLLHSSVEWYSPSEFKTKIFSHVYLLNNIHNKISVRKPVKVIAISKYFEEYYKKKSLDTIRVPVIMDNGIPINNRQSNEDRINIAYVGSPGKKDYLQNIIKAFTLLSSRELEKVYFHIVGVNQKDILKLTKTLLLDYNKISKYFYAYGRVPHEQAVKILRASDFSIVVRPENERYAKAGFPTKVVEAMFNGIAVMCNITSDLGLYLSDMDNAIILKNESPEEVAKGIIKATTLSRQMIINMGQHSRETAEKYFDYHNYIEKMKYFIDKKDEK